MKAVTKKRHHKIRMSSVFIYAVLGIISIVALIPFIHIIACTFAPAEDFAKDGFLLIPSAISLDALRYIFSARTFNTAMFNSIYITIVGTTLSVVSTTIFAYPLAQKRLMGRNAFMFIIVLTMVFNPGMIPNFLNVRDMGLIDSTWSMILPGLIVTYNMILVKNFFQSMSEELTESAKIDGASELTIFSRIILPLAKPVLATISLFYAVAYWNNYMAAILYINDDTKWPIQVLLRNIVIMSQTNMESDSQFVEAINAESLKSATIFVSTIPILCVYPLAQKYFVKGLMMGSVKG